MKVTRLKNLVLILIGVAIGLGLGTNNTNAVESKLMAAEVMMGWATQRAVKAAGDAGYQQGLMECATANEPQRDRAMEEMAVALMRIADGCVWLPEADRLEVIKLPRTNREEDAP